MKRWLVLLAAFALFAPLLLRTAAAQDMASLKVSENPSVGAFLTDANGKTLYLFTKDTTANESACDGDCATNWPPVPAEGLSLPEGVPGELGSIDRADGVKQASYNGIPLYVFAGDSAAGDINGEGVGGVWFVVAPGATHGEYAAAPGEGTPAPASTLHIGFTEELGPFLTDAKGMTLYLFEKDTTANESTCEGDCAANWPPAAAEGTLTLPAGIPGELTAITRADGSQQLSYNGIPLYHYAADKAAGDTNGQEVGDVWYVVTPGMQHGDEPHESEEHEGEEMEATPAS
jgi:predicted lipoprotein with Yx(FWY)xxD motif